MRIRKVWPIVLSVILVALLGVGLWAGAAQAQPPLQQPSTGTTIPYPGHLTGGDGQPLADGSYAFTFALYNTAKDGDPLWSETQEGVAVRGGNFLASLGSANPIPTSVLQSSDLWLEVAVRGPAEASFTTLAPRQRLSAAQLGAGIEQAAPCAHDHWGESWSSETGTGLRLDRVSGMLALNGVNLASDSGEGLYAYSMTYDGVSGASMGPDKSGVYGHHTGPTGTGYGIYGATDSDNGGYGVYGRASTTTGTSTGVFGGSENGPGVVGRSAQGNGVEGYSTNGHAIYASGDWAVGVYAESNHLAALFGHSVDGVGLSVTCDSGDIIRAFGASGSPDIEFSVSNDGNVYADGQYLNPASGFAEMLPGAAGLEAGDVLVAGPDGKLARCDAAYQPTVVGVYAAQAGFVGGAAEDTAGQVPLAVMGVVQVKVSAENGPIVPGDLLVASSTPGHTMKAGPNPPQGTVIGKALAGLDNGTGVIQMLVMLQ